MKFIELVRITDFPIDAVGVELEYVRVLYSLDVIIILRRHRSLVQPGRHLYLMAPP